MSVLAQSRDDDAGLVGALARCSRRDRSRRRCGADSALRRACARSRSSASRRHSAPGASSSSSASSSWRPKRVPSYLLTISARNCGARLRRVLARRAARHMRAFGGNERAHEPHRLGRRRDDDARIAAQAQTQHQHVPGLGIAPRGQLVAPGGIVLRAAQAFGLVGREAGGDGAVGPSEAALRGLVERPEIGRRDGEEPALALDHDIARIGGGGRDQGDAARAPLLHQHPHPFGAAARLAEAAAGEQQPDAPVCPSGGSCEGRAQKRQS